MAVRLSRAAAGFRNEGTVDLMMRAQQLERELQRALDRFAPALAAYPLVQTCVEKFNADTKI